MFVSPRPGDSRFQRLQARDERVRREPNDPEARSEDTSHLFPLAFCCSTKRGPTLITRRLVRLARRNCAEPLVKRFGTPREDRHVSSDRDESGAKFEIMPAEPLVRREDSRAFPTAKIFVIVSSIASTTSGWAGLPR
jgi:hypothetical protein